ncbi:MAG: DUF2796 domain-containing protein [Rhodocyclaceae bacterium]|nr:DUF2796 domain-containing protein [Rhodocyclaceae bacterium]
MKPFPLFAMLALAACPVLAPRAHTHGEGRLVALLEGASLTLEIAVPLEAAAGFERPPRNDKEKDLLAKARQTLGEASHWRINAEARCQLEHRQVSVPFLDSFEQSQGPAPTGDASHADIEARFVYRCAHPEALKSLETTLFRLLPRLYRFEAIRIGPRGQGKARLTPKTPTLSW